MTNKKTILITGANGGMGRLCTTLALEAGYNHLVLTDLASPKFDAFVSELKGQGVAVSAANVDVTDAAAVASLTDQLAREGGVDAIIHTVGVTPSIGNWELIIEIDLVSTAKFLEAVRPQLNAGGAAVCISSSSGYIAPANEALESLLADPFDPQFFDKIKAQPENACEHPGLAYSYAKKALRQHVARQAMAWGREGKRIVSISPGLIDTEAGQVEYKATDNFDSMVSAIPLQRLGLPSEIAHTALFLLSDKASYISGCDILVDGGMVAGMGKSV